MPYTNRPIIQLLQKKLLTCGVKTLSDAELLALFIQNNTKNKTAIDLALSLLYHFGGIRNIFDAPAIELCNLAGIGKAKYIKLQAILEISQRYLEEQLINTNVISNTEAAVIYLTAKLRGHKRETFACILLNNQNRVIHYTELFYGTINNIAIYPREIVKIGLQYNASGIIFAHNHPTGTPTPSPQDQHLTNVLIKILRPLDIKVLDHIIIGSNGYASLINL